MKRAINAYLKKGHIKAVHVESSERPRHITESVTQQLLSLMIAVI